MSDEQIERLTEAGWRTPADVKAILQARDVIIREAHAESDRLRADLDALRTASQAELERFGECEVHSDAWCFTHMMAKPCACTELARVLGDKPPVTDIRAYP